MDIRSPDPWSTVKHPTAVNNRTSILKDNRNLSIFHSLFDPTGGHTVHLSVWIHEHHLHHSRTIPTLHNVPTLLRLQ